MSPLRALEALHWYLRELTGESAYDRYAEGHRARCGDTPPLSRREFERERTRQRDDRPGIRCC
ncbi:YbdD/YjiX family protein [Micromonospora sp. NPDC047548]|uniref:YbdD/YjiX family protein n=1 Tax=Micromonospora sp. NPDC047548 TaxID=3155624 RepID=UPI00340D9C9E